MKKRTLIIASALALAAIVIVALLSFRDRAKELPPATVSRPSPDYLDAAFMIGGIKVTLANGLSETEAAPGSATKIVTRYFGNDVRHDFDSDGREDVAFLVTQESGGSGVFFYLVVALNRPGGYAGSDGLLLGDRIAPQSSGIDEGIAASGNPRKDVIVVNYADRLPGEPFSAAPSIGKSIWAKLDPASMTIAEVAPDFEGERR